MKTNPILNAEESANHVGSGNRRSASIRQPLVTLALLMLAGIPVHAQESVDYCRTWVDSVLHVLDGREDIPEPEKVILAHRAALVADVHQEHCLRAWAHILQARALDRAGMSDSSLVLLLEVGRILGRVDCD